MKKSAGFGIIGIVILIATITLVGVLTWKVYDTNKTTSAPNVSSSEDPADPVHTTTYLNVKELGIRIKLEDQIKDVTYTAEKLSDGSWVAKFSTETLAAQDSNCNATFGPLGTIEKTTVDTDRAGTKKVVDDVSVFKLGNDYYSYSAPQALCSEKVRTTEATARSAFREAFKSLQEDR